MKIQIKQRTVVIFDCWSMVLRLLRNTILVTLTIQQILPAESAEFNFGTCRTFYTESPLGQNLFSQGCPGHKHKEWSSPGKKYGSTYKQIKVAYIDFPPYIYSDGNPSNPRGIFVGYVEDFVDRACPDADGVQWEHYQFASARLLQDHCRTNQYLCGMSVPTLGYRNSLMINRNEWAAFFTNRGVSFITIHEEIRKVALPKLITKILEVWPFLAILFSMAFFAGVIIWILEMKNNNEEFPTPYYIGISNGFWWSFISMTTVGYGDRVPITFIGRVFSIFWIIFGISMFSVLVSMFASSVSNAVEVPEVVMSGNTIGILGITSAAYGVVDKNGGIPRVATSIAELERWFVNGEIAGIAMDTRELEYHWKQRLSKLDMVNRIHLERVYPFDREYGLSVYASNLETEHFRKIAPESSQPWDDCMKAYVSDNDEHMEKMENYYVATEKDNMNGSFAIPKDEEPFNMFDPDEDVYKELVCILLYISLAILLIGIPFEFVRMKWFKKVAEEDLDGEEDGLTDIEQTTMTKEEKRIHRTIMKSVHLTDDMIKGYQKSTMEDLSEMANSLRKQMKLISSGKYKTK